MARIFVYDGRRFPDPGEELTVEQVKERMAAIMPEIANGQVKETQDGEDTVYEFTRRVGTKGS